MIDDEDIISKAKHIIFEEVIEKIKADEQCSKNEALSKFISSTTFAMLESNETELYGESPKWVYGLYKAEQNNSALEYLK